MPWFIESQGIKEGLVLPVWYYPKTVHSSADADESNNHLITECTKVHTVAPKVVCVIRPIFETSENNKKYDAKCPKSQESRWNVCQWHRTRNR
jgi:hypothetical protein